jgi:hypothetical protein
MEILNASLTYTLSLTNYIYLFAVYSPFTFYFIGFINFMAKASFYVLLDFPIPEGIYRYLSSFTKDKVSNFLVLAGLDLNFSPISQERVDRARPSFFGVTSDFVAAECSLMINFFINIGLVFAASGLSIRFLSPSNCLRKYLSSERWNLLYGRIIKMMVPIILPWTFVLMRNAPRNVWEEINTTLHLFFIYLVIFFSFYYLLELVLERKK